MSMSPGPSTSSSTSSSLVRRALLFTSCVGLMVGAFVAATHLEGPTAQASPVAPAPVATTSPAPAPDVASAPPKADAETRADTPATLPPAARTMPDLKGKRLTVALREAKKLGIRLVAADDDGYRPDPSEASDYRVRRQSVTAGTDLAEAQSVKVTVRPTGASLGGY